MTIFINLIADQLNLRWAWDKVRHQAISGDTWFDEHELAAFELELERSLNDIAARFRDGTFRLAPLRPLPYPKGKDKAGNVQVRQSFYVSVRDQVAWTAVVNVVGPYVDCKMPPWSYGNRLFRTIWIEEVQDEESGKVTKHRRFGKYRNASGKIYLPFRQSWPIFRRHVYLTTLAMASAESEPAILDEQTVEEKLIQINLEEQYRCPFIMREYWHNRQPATEAREIYWCSIDLKSFYPTLNLEVVRKNIVESLPVEWRDEADPILDLLLDFRLDTMGWDQDAVEQMVQRNRRTFKHIPTGLYVAGFLANAGLLDVDREISQRLLDHHTAHFRYVDDHIVLAYSFDELLSWVRSYQAILEDFGTGTRINLNKVQPETLGYFLHGEAKNRSSRAVQSHRKHAEKDCLLDPRFPSPLMTKTLAMVSALARTDFNLLELTEREAITGQLEHLLLVDIPDEEMPHRTRMSFAATRLMRMAEARLACPSPAQDVQPHQEAIPAQGRLFPSPERQIKRDSWSEVRRVFQLFRRAIRERPDSIRLWARAVQMCRAVGTTGMADLIEDLRLIEKNRECSPLSVEYLTAIILNLAGSQAVVAANIVRNRDVALWRREAARNYLEKDIKATVALSPKGDSHWFINKSWLQFCVGVYAADLIVRSSDTPGSLPVEISLPIEALEIGRKCMKGGLDETSAIPWVWWASRGALFHDSSPSAPQLVKELGASLSASPEAAALWRFFPSDVPLPILKGILQDSKDGNQLRSHAGWWFDCLRERPSLLQSLSPRETKSIPPQVRRLLGEKQHRVISLYDWCEAICRMPNNDPRNGEWTALEIVSQIASHLESMTTVAFGADYVKDPNARRESLPFVHPANFYLPAEWLNWSKAGRKEPSWEEWRSVVRETRVHYVSKKNRILDRRYTPMELRSLLVQLNPVRGLGLLLFGLLHKTFALPALWNGSGQSEVLGRLPRMLLRNLACSSWTLGVLGGCLWPRSSENVLQNRFPQTEYIPADDTLHDPAQFIDVRGVRRGIEITQRRLQDLQISTLGGNARQLTPINLRQLTVPEWNKDFEIYEVEGLAHEA